MEEILETKKNGLYVYKSDNGECVRLWTDDLIFEYQKDPNDDDTYITGTYSLKGNTVYYFSGCIELPKAIQKAMLFYGYSLDL